MNKYVKYEYILFFNNISHKSCDYFLDLCYKNINQDDAYNILMSIPFIKKKNTLEEINYIRPEIINYNYKWCLALLSHNFPIQIIQNLLTHFFEYYYINIIYINMIIKNPYSSYVVMREFIPITQKYAQIYYQLKLRNIEALMAYDMATINNITRYIYELICYDYTDLEFVKKAIYLSKEQLDFLKFSRYCYSSIEVFNKYKYNIFSNALNKNFININDFEISEKGEIIINQ